MLTYVDIGDVDIDVWSPMTGAIVTGAICDTAINYSSIPGNRFPRAVMAAGRKWLRVSSTNPVEGEYKIHEIPESLSLDAILNNYRSLPEEMALFSFYNGRDREIMKLGEFQQDCNGWYSIRIGRTLIRVFPMMHDIEISP